MPIPTPYNEDAFWYAIWLWLTANGAVDPSVTPPKTQ